MRVRSSQFVFLLLLMCSVQLRDDCTLRLAAGAMAGHFGQVAQRQESVASERSQGPQLEAEGQTAASVLPAAITEVWPMTRPALDAAAVTSHTSFLRG